MENRFGLKDLAHLLLTCVLIVVVLLAMKQYDRQWDILDEIKKQGSDQTRELVAIRKALVSGVPVAARAGGQTSTASARPAEGESDPFVHVRAAQKNPDYATGDWHVDNLPAQVAKLTPLVATDLYQRIVENKVMESLVFYDPATLDSTPLLARSYQISPDGKTITFQLREGVTFSDGDPFDADDVVFTFEWIRNPKVAAPRERSTLELLDTVTKKGQYEVVFTFKEPYYNSVNVVGTQPLLAKHFYGKFTPEKFNLHLGLLIGTGPYKLKDPEYWRPGTKIELYRNDLYWGEPGAFNRIIYNEVTNQVAAQTMFRNGDLDRYPAQPDEHVEMLKDQQLVARTKHFAFLPPTGGYQYICWNQKYKGQTTPFADKRVRQAMTMLIDRGRIADDVYRGYAVIADGPFEPGSEQSDPSIKPLPYNPDAAKALLAQAGYADRNGDGVLEGPDGKPFRFSFTYTTSNPQYERAVFLIKDTLARAGIAVDLDPQEWPILSQRLHNRDFQVITLRWGGGDPEGDIRQMFHSSQIGDNGDNFMSYTNPQLDAAIDKARTTIDKDARMKLWRECHRILHEDQPYTFVICAKYLYWFDNRIQNVKEDKIGLNYFHYNLAPIPWYVPAAKQKYKD
jgi:peptide/nickel transport system substrate-binding protein